MSTNLLWGIAGAAASVFFTGGLSYIGIGFLAGSLLGSIIDPPKIVGPKRTDLRLQRSEYGWTIPWVWGRWRAAGNVIDQTDLIPHKQTTGGKGGPEIETETYSASFQIYLCQRPQGGFVEVLRLWADGRLVWDVQTGDACPFTLYDGDEAQLPDPTFEAINGIGNEPAYRGVVRAVFADQALAEFGDRIPQYEFEINTKAGAFPWRVSNFDPVPTGGAGVAYVVIYAEGFLTVAHYDGTSGNYHERVFDIHGVEDTSLAYNAAIDGGPNNMFPIANILAAMWGTGGALFYREHLAATIAVNPLGGPVNVTNGVYQTDYIFTVCSNQVSGHVGVARWPAVNGVIDAGTGTSAGSWDFGIIAGGTSGCVIGVTNRPANAYVCIDHVTLYEMALDLMSIVRTWDLTAVDTISPVMNGGGFTVWENPQGQLILACDRGIGGGKNASAFYLNSDLTVTYVGNVVAIGLTIAPITELGTSGLCLIQDGIISLIPPPAPVILGDIVDDITDLTPLRGNIDVSELTDLVTGYAVGEVMAARNAIEPLRKGWPFDIVEIDFGAVAKRRGATASLVTIPAADLDARLFGEPAGDLLRVTREREQATPRRVKLKYDDIDLDYQTGNQNSPLLTGLSEQDVSVDLPIVFTATEAIHVAWVLLLADIIERETFEWSTTSAYGWLSQCDVVTIEGRIIRITEFTLTPEGIIKWKGVLHRPSIYVQEQPGAPAVGWNPQTPPGAVVPTEMLLLDIPMLADSDFERGIRVAMGPSRDGKWTGASSYKSSDGGTNYLVQSTVVAPDVIGTCTTTLPAWLGGYTFDESSVLDVALSDDDALLINYSADAILNGAGFYLVGLEIVQAKNAALTGTKTGRLSGFLRGCRGTEWAMGTHAPNERFCVLPVADVDMTTGELFQTRMWKGVSHGKTLASATAQSFANMGQAARPLSPSLVGGGSDASGNLTFNWARRTRIGGEWRDFAASPLGEATEAYVVQIWNASKTVVARIITGITSPTNTYSGANQVTDFGAVQQTITYSVGQVGSYQLGTQTFAVIPSTGGSNNEPIVTTPPYNAPPIPGAGGGGTVNIVLAWANDSQVTSGYKVGDTYVAQFTTGGSPPASGHIATAEHGDPAYFRHVRLCTDAAGLSLVPNGEQYGTTCLISFTDAILAASTTYYFVIRTELGNGSPSGPLGSSANMRLDLLSP